MSYWIHLIHPACSACGSKARSVDGFELNVTRNVSKIANICLDAADPKFISRLDPAGNYSWWRLDGHRAGDVLKLLEVARAASKDEIYEPNFKALEPSNGWGTLASLRSVFDALVEACEAHPDAVFSVSG